PFWKSLLGSFLQTPQSQWAPRTSRARQTPQCSPHGLIVTLAPAWLIYTTRVSTMTFNVQSGPEFQDRVINSESPVVADFHAQWWGPCRILGPRLEKMVAKQHRKVVMAKVDTDGHTDFAMEYEVLGGEHALGWGSPGRPLILEGLTHCLPSPLAGPLVLCAGGLTVNKPDQ
uniref:Thioredoxin domain-containing protein n=1 Tax=Equus asinus TaxID=9793 RepID=A0A8C4PMH3_EQUAS